MSIDEAKNYSTSLGQNPETTKYFIKVNLGEDIEPVTNY